MESDQRDEHRVALDALERHAHGAAGEALEREHDGRVTDSLLIVVLCVLRFLVCFVLVLF